MDNIEARKQAILTGIQQLRAETSQAVFLRAAAEEERAETRADMLAVLGRITALKTLYNLMPDSLKQIIAKYTDANPNA